jgi:hypothetical protein
MPLVMIRRLGLSGVLMLVFAVAAVLFGQAQGGSHPEPHLDGSLAAASALRGQMTVAEPDRAPRRHDIARADLGWPFFSFRRRGAR